MMNSPLFSVIVPAYNVERLINRCISSIINQSCDNFELIIVNDGSADGTLNECLKFKNDTRVKIISTENKGVSAARNTGITNSSGSYIVFVDADDYIDREMLKSFYAAMENSNCDFCISGFFENGKSCNAKDPQSIVGNNTLFELKNSQGYFNLLFENGFINAIWGKCYRRELVQSPFYEDIRLGEDLLFNLKYFGEATKVCVLSSPLYYYSLPSGNSLSSNYSKSTFDTLAVVFDETKKNMERIWGGKSDFRLVQKKYVYDMIVLFERYYRVGKDSNKIEYSQYLFEKYGLETVFKTTKFEERNKYYFEKFLLSHRLFHLFGYFTISIYKLRNLIRRG